MRELMVLSIMFLASVVTRGQEFFTPASEEAHLSLKEHTVDLGFLPADTIAGGEIEFTNTGGSPLVITQIFSDCGCTVADYPRDPIAPGEKGRIKVSFNSKGRQPGDFKKSLRIRSNADNRREIIFVKGKIKRIYKR